MTIIPRPYQKEALKMTLPALRKFGKALIVLATGLGKTIAAALIVKSFGKLPGIFLVHNNDILERAVGEFQKVFGADMRYGLYNGHTKEIEGCDIVFASFQTMARNLEQFKRNQFAWMIVDEGHHAQADTYRKVIEYFRCAKLGVTATPDRMDMKNIRDLFGNEVIDVSLEEAIARGWLPRIEYHLVTDEGLDENRLKQLAKEIRDSERRISIQEINRRVFIRARDEKIAKIIEGYAEKTVIFCRNVHHAEDFKKYILRGETYHSKNSRERNRKSLLDLRNGLTRRILAVNAFNEGIDVPDVGLVVFNRATDSETIFRQQLGRGMRPGKDKLIVLDFVGNAERIQMLKKMTDTIAHYHEKFTTPEERDLEGYSKDTFHLTGKGFEFTFADKVVEIMTMIDRANVEFYPTWQEASSAARALGANNSVHYSEIYKKDPKLPCCPNRIYPDFPGWDSFLGKTEFYGTWQEASSAARALGASSSKHYLKIYKKNPKLSSSPNQIYPDFPGWDKFLEKLGFYKTWQEASIAARALGASSLDHYSRVYKRDARLTSYPNKIYPNFPGWKKFLGKTEFYGTWQEASKVSISLGAKDVREYNEVYKKDPRLPCHPYRTYPDFPGWEKFLRKIQKKRVTDAYPTWQIASKAAKRLKIIGAIDYNSKRLKDPRLPAAPHGKYRDFPGWKKFLGTAKYATWIEARKAVRKLGITSAKEYAERYSEDPRLHHSPYHYKDYPGWC